MSRFFRRAVVIGLSTAFAAGVPALVPTALGGVVPHAATAQTSRASLSTHQASIVVSPSVATVAGDITLYPDPDTTYPIGIVTGSDGALWYTSAGNGSIGRITTAGVITHYTATGISRAFGIAAGPDGALWFTNTGSGGHSIGQITTGGSVTIFTDPLITEPDWIASGPDGNLWVTNNAGGGFTDPSILKITTGGTVTRYTDSTISEPAGIVAGSDGALWFVNSIYSGTNGGAIGRITTTGTVTKYTYTGSYQPYGIAAGPDGALWFTNGSPGIGSTSIERVTTSGSFSHFSSADLGYLGGGYQFGGGGITTGPDGALWFTDAGPGTLNGSIVVGRLSTTGKLTTYINPNSDVAANEIAAGPDHAMWFTMGTRGIGRISTVPGPAKFLPFTLGGTKTTLHWKNPAGIDFSHVVIRRSSGGGPSTVVFNGPGTSYADTHTVVGTTYTYSITAYNKAGVAQAVAAHTRQVRALNAPKVMVANPTSTTQTHLRFPVSWGSGNPAGTHYTAQWAVRSGATWALGTPHLLASGTTSHAAVTGKAGQTYYLRASVSDGLGNGATTAYKPANVPLDQSVGTLAGGWTTAKSSADWLGSAAKTSHNGATFTAKVHARELGIIATRCGRCGAFKVYVGGHLVATVSTKASSIKVRQLVWHKTYSSVGARTLKVVAVLTSGKSLLLDGIDDAR